MGIRARSKPGKMNYGSAGNGSAGHLAMEYLKMTADMFITHIPYKGTGPQLTDLLAGRLDAASVGASAILPQIKAGKLRCIATGSTQRLPQLPDVGTGAAPGPFLLTICHGRRHFASSLEVGRYSL